MIYIFGHKRPDTDSICASISLSYLKNELGYKTVPMTLGSINNETKYALEKFKLPVPEYLNDVKLQIKDISYKKGCHINEHKTIIDGYHYMVENGLSGVPVVNKSKKLLGLVTLKELAKELIEGDFRRLHTSYDNLLSSLKGEEVFRFDEQIDGNILAASFRSTTFLENVKLNCNDVLIVGDRHVIVEYAIKSKIKLLIIVGNGHIKEEHLALAKKNKVNIIRTSYDTYHATQLVNLSNYIKSVVFKETPVTFEETDYYTEFFDISNKLKHTNYPIVNKRNVCLGLLPVTLASDRKNKEVILVDHNEKSQSVDGLEEATIKEVVDHHKLGTVATSSPINFRNMAVGSTNTIIYKIYKENKIKIPKDIAGAMLSGIISDTLILKSPTTTRHDREAVEQLSKVAKVDYVKYGMEMFKAGSSLKGKTIEEIIYSDFKKFNYDSKNIGVGQVTTTDTDYILDNKEDYINELNNVEDYDIVALFITDVIKNGSYILFSDKSETILTESFSLENLEQGHYFKDLVSRKKQILPLILEVLEKK